MILTITCSLDDEESADVLFDSVRNVVDQVAAADPDGLVEKSIEFGSLGMSVTAELIRERLPDADDD